MINRVSVSTLLKSAFGVMAAAVILVLAMGAWDASTRLRTANKISANTEASAYLFTALSTLRTARAFTSNALLGDKVGDLGPVVASTRPTGMAAAKNALVALQNASLPAGSSAIASLQESFDRVVAFYKEADAAIMLPKAQRRQGLADDGFKIMTTFLANIESVSSQLATVVKFEDPYVG